MIDRYTKFILTVIAICLIGLLIRPLFNQEADKEPIDVQVVGIGSRRDPTLLGLIPARIDWEPIPVKVEDWNAGIVPVEVEYWNVTSSISVEQD